MSISGSGVSRLAQLASRLPIGSAALADDSAQSRRQEHDAGAGCEGSQPMPD